MGTALKRNGTEHIDLVQRGQVTIKSASLSQGLLTDDSVKLSVNSNKVLDIKINDTFEVFGQVYRINQLPTLKKNNSRSYDYEIIAGGLMYDLKRVKFFNADATGFKTESTFPLIGNLEIFLITIRNNMARFSADWEVGTFTNTETKMINFGDDTCLSALQKICQEFKTDFWIRTENGKYKINTGSYGNTLPVTFEYGKGKGLYSLSRKNVDENGIVNRLYVNGGTENIPSGYRNFSQNLKFSDEGYLEDTDLIAEIGLIEGSIEFPEIYPKRTGTITSLGDTKFKFRDSSMDFDLNEKDLDGATKYLIPGTSAKIHFNKGNLAGYEFEIKKGGYNHVDKEFEIKPFKNDSGQQFPDEVAEAFQFEVGDEYVLLDIVMPETYVTNAEAELLTKGTEQFDLNKSAKVSYDLTVDPEYLKTLATPINIGDYVRIIDVPLGIDKVIRVNEITRQFITDGEPTPFDYSLVIADSYEINFASQMVLDIKDIKNVVTITNLGHINLSMLGYKTTEELKNIIFDTDGFFDPENIKPFSIQTNMLSVGAQSQQLSCSVVFLVNNDGNPNQVEQKTGVLFSQTFNKTWNISGSTVTIPDNNFRYVYAKCSKTGTSGSIVFSPDKITFDENPNDYFFLLGILHTVVEGVRILSITIGTTTINGGLIRTGIISSLDGQTYFNLDTGEIKGKITFTSDSPAFNQINSSIVIGGRNLLRNSKNKPIAQGAGTSIQLANGFSVTDSISYNGFGSVGVLEHGQNYTFSIRVKRITGTNSGSAIQMFLNDANAYLPIPNSENLTSEFKTFSLTRTFAGSQDTYLYLIFPSGEIQVEYLKLEKGTKTTDWTPAVEDVDTNIQNAYENSINAINTANATAAVTSFLQTTIDGNVVSTGTLQVGDVNGANAMICGVTDKPNGESIRFAAGKTYAEKYNSPYQVLDNGMVRFVNPTNGQKVFQLGYNQNTGKVVFDIFDENGVKVASIGSQGIMFTGYIAESYTTSPMRKLTTTTFTEIAIRTEIQDRIQNQVTSMGTPINNPPWVALDISIQENYTAHLYNEGRNFESAGNAQYAGYHISANKFDSWIPNGIYVDDIIQPVICGNFMGQNRPYTFNYVATAYRIVDGVIVEVMAVNVTKTVDKFGNWVIV